ncbi:MAG: PH domain-containing protein [Candidatus Nealsonbacteria bacterium]|nr:PH domain-containing protein [Candidatus Nealsonbacteria bacterium]
MIKFREGEKIYEVKRRHPFVIIKSLLMIGLLFLIVLIFMFILFFTSFSFPEFLTDIAPFLLEVQIRFLGLFACSLILLILWQSAFISFANYYLDCWIITSERTIHTELKSFFSRIISSVSHSKIQDITINIKGFLPTILKYGDLQIQTAGKFHEFIFKEISNPYETKEVIYKAKKDMEKGGIYTEENNNV